MRQAGVASRQGKGGSGLAEGWAGAVRESTLKMWQVFEQEEARQGGEAGKAAVSRCGHAARHRRRAGEGVKGGSNRCAAWLSVGVAQRGAPPLP